MVDILKVINNMKTRILNGVKKTLDSIRQSELLKDVEWQIDGLLWVDNLIGNVEA